MSKLKALKGETAKATGHLGEANRLADFLKGVYYTISAPDAGNKAYIIAEGVQNQAVDDNLTADYYWSLSIHTTVELWFEGFECINLTDSRAKMARTLTHFIMDTPNSSIASTDKPFAGSVGGGQARTADNGTRLVLLGDYNRTNKTAFGENLTFINLGIHARPADRQRIIDVANIVYSSINSNLAQPKTIQIPAAMLMLAANP